MFFSEQCYSFGLAFFENDFFENPQTIWFEFGLCGFDFDRISKAPIGIDENHCMDETHCFPMNSATLLVHFFVKMVVFEMPLQIRCMCTVSIATSATSATMADGRWIRWIRWMYI